MNLRAPISIRKVKNGYIIEPSPMRDPTYAHSGLCNDEIVVFNKIEDLNYFLVKHFEPKEVDNHNDDARSNNLPINQTEIK